MKKCDEKSGFVRFFRPSPRGGQPDVLCECPLSGFNYYLMLFREEMNMRAKSFGKIRGHVSIKKRGLRLTRPRYPVNVSSMKQKNSYPNFRL
jgi:hypothetical protein